MNQSAAAPWVDVLLGTDRIQRVRVAHSLVAGGMYLGLGGIICLGVLMGLVEASAAMVPVASLLGVSALFYGLIRSGLNQRFASDPALTQAQGFFCVFACCACYVAAPALRGGVLMAVLIGQAFGIFAFTTRQAWRMAALGVVSLGATMVGCVYLDPSSFPPRVEMLNFLMVALALPAIAWLTVTLSRIRNKSRQQKVQLANALAQNKLLATQDELTGLSNRRHMMALMVSERGRQMRSRSPISMVLMDIDYFKRINDSCGHQAGDQVLQIFADVITHGLRVGDSLARWGGEEFLLMLPGTSADEALICVERMRSQLAARSFSHLSPDLQVTFSAGIGVCGMEDRTDAIIERADRALYQAKTTGRNRTVVA